MSEVNAKIECNLERKSTNYQGKNRRKSNIRAQSKS